MSREDEIAVLLRADTLLMAILTGGVYTDEEVGVEGFRREEGFITSAAFDSDGYLLPCALVRQRGVNPYGNVRSVSDKYSATSQAVEIYYYENRGHSSIDLAKERAYLVLEGERLTRSYPIWWDFETPHYPDMGPVRNSTVMRQDWRIVSRRGPV